MLLERIQKDIITAMKAKDELTKDTLRMAKSAIDSKAKDKGEPLTDDAVEAVLSTLIKQRKDSAEQFTKGDRPELAEKELAEITLLEKYLPREASEAELVLAVHGFLMGITASGQAITPKLMGAVIAGVKVGLAHHNLRADGKLLSTIVKTELEKEGK